MESEPQRMDELKELVRQNIALAQENNQILHALRRGAWVSRALRIFWIALIIGSSVYAYWYVQPYLDQLLGLYGNLQSLQERAAGFFNQPPAQ
jgi:hypothetical protein